MASLNNLTEFMQNGPQFTLVGNAHENLDIQAFVSSPGFFNALHEAGVQHLFLEQPREYEDIESMHMARFQEQNFQSPEEVQAFVENEMAKSLEEIPEFYAQNPGNERIVRETYLQTGYAALYDVQIHYYDFAVPPDDSSRLGMELDPVPRDDAYRCFTSPYNEIDRRSFSQKLFGPPLDELQDRAELRERLSRDDLMGANILEKAGNDRSLVMIGELHLSNPEGLDEYFGTSAQTLFMHSTVQYYEERLTGSIESAEGLGMDFTQLAHGNHFIIESGEIFTPAPDEAAQLETATSEWRGPVCKEKETDAVPAPQPPI